MPIPQLDATSRKRPLCYDSARKKFIRFSEIISGKEKIIPIDSLTYEDLKKLVIKRWQVLPKNTYVQTLTGSIFIRDQVIKAIEKDDEFGQMILEADKSYLRDFLDEIQRNL